MNQRAELPVVDLVSRARRGDAASFEQLVRGHERLALGVAFGVLQDAQAAGDVVQDAMLKAWRHLPDLAEPHRFAAWLCGIVRNLCVDRKRRKGVPVCGIEQAAAHTDGRAAAPVDELGRREARQRVAAAMETLDEVTRCCLALRYYDGLSSREIADLLGLSAAAVDMRLMRGRQALKEKLAEVVG